MSSTIYNRIKALEGQFPIPTPHATVLVGTFDAATGKFAFNPSVRIERHVDPITHVPDITHTLPAQAVNVGLEFAVINRQGNFDVSLINGLTVSAPPNQNTVTIEIGKGTSGDFTVTSGSHSFTSDLGVAHRIVSAGAFTIPALPIAIVYAPPQGSLRTNSVSYDAVTSVGTKTKLSISSEQSTTMSDIDNLGDYRQQIHDILTDLGAGLATGIPAASLSLLSDLIGSTETTNITGFTVTDDHALQIVDTREYKNGSETGEGPPEGNRIILLRNVELVWLVDNGQITLSVLSTPERTAFPVRELLDDLQRPFPGTVTGLDHDTIRALLQLDPFVSLLPIPNFRPRLVPPRFTKVDEPSVLGGSGTGPGGDVISFTHTVITTDLHTEVNIAGTIVDQSAGWLSSLGIGPQESQTVKNIFTNSSSTEKSVGQAVSVSITFNTQGNEQYRVIAFYDTIFETIAFDHFPQAPNPGTL
jgi:hypothetical protein